MIGVSQEFVYVDILVLLKNNEALLRGGGGGVGGRGVSTLNRVFNKISSRWQKLWSRWGRKDLR